MYKTGSIKFNSMKEVLASATIVEGEKVLDYTEEDDTLCLVDAYGFERTVSKASETVEYNDIIIGVYIEPEHLH